MSKKKKASTTSRKIGKALQRKEDAQDGDLKSTLAEVRKAREKPPRIGTKIVLREDARRMHPTPGLGDVMRKKNGEKILSSEEVRIWIRNGHRAIPHPELAFPGSVET